MIEAQEERRMNQADDGRRCQERSLGAVVPQVSGDVFSRDFRLPANDDNETNQTTATAMAKQSLRPQAVSTRLSHLLSHWPSDPVRPASVSVQTYLQSRGARLPQDQQQGQPQQNVAGGVTAQTAEISESSLNALSSLLEDRFARRFPLSPKLRHPASNPEHYDNVVREFQEAPSRDWMGRLKKRLSGLFRVS